jgi:hypothetical protein
MADPPRLHNKLGANWVEVTKTVFGWEAGSFWKMRANLKRGQQHPFLIPALI